MEQSLWYSDRYRRHLCDMHIEDWSDEFLSEFSPEAYVRNLKTAGINVAMLYFQSHIGLCYWPTKTGIVHRIIKKDPLLIRRVVDLCHENDIRVVGYYSINYNTREHDRHPEWRKLLPSGKSSREEGVDVTNMAFASLNGARYGLLCSNNREYRDFVLAQTDEMLDFFAPDGMFYDMPFGTTCFCPVCRARFMKETGHELPVSAAPDSPENKEVSTALFRWMGEFVQEITDHIKARFPEMPVEHNFAAAISEDSDNACGEEVAAACDYCGGDLYGDLYNQSVTCKFMRAMSKHQPFEYMFSRCKPGLRAHTMTKTLDQMKTSLSVTMAHHGATLVIDAIDPVGTMDERVYRRFAEMFAFQAPYEKYFTGAHRKDVGVWYGLRSKNDIHGEPMNGKLAAIGALKAMIRAHVPADVVGLQKPEEFSCVIAPLLWDTEPRADELIDYVKNGGTVYLSGGEHKQLIETLTGGTLVGRTEENRIYFAPVPGQESLFGGFNEKYPLPLPCTAVLLKPAADTQVLAKIKVPYTRPMDREFASIHSDPPGKLTDWPAVTFNRFGKGRVLWSAEPFEQEEMDEYGQILLNLLTKYGGLAPSVRSDAPEDVEITVFDEKDFSTVNCVHLDGRTVCRPIYPFSVSVRCDRAPVSVSLLPEKTPVSFAYQDGFVTFEARSLHIFDMYKIDFKG